LRVALGSGFCFVSSSTLALIS